MPGQQQRVETSVFASLFADLSGDCMNTRVIPLQYKFAVASQILLVCWWQLGVNYMKERASMRILASKKIGN